MAVEEVVKLISLRHIALITTITATMMIDKTINMVMITVIIMITVMIMEIAVTMIVDTVTITRTAQMIG